MHAFPPFAQVPPPMRPDPKLSPVTVLLVLAAIGFALAIIMRL